MTILAVSNNFSLLERLCNGLSSILPDADIIRETDSLMAGKYSFNHHIDMMFADVNMKMKQRTMKLLTKKPPQLCRVCRRRYCLLQ